MEFGVLSLLPPVIAIVIAIWSRQTILSLFIGVWLGATIINNWNPLTGFTHSITDFVIPSIASPWNASLLLLVTLAGGFINVLKVTGAALAFANSTTKKINSRKKAQNFIWGSAFLFSYTEPVLILGTITRPIADKMRVSRVKLAYILDSMGCSLASMSPISSYGPFITGLIATQIAALSLSDKPWSLFFQMLPYNFYGIFAMIGVLFVINSKLDIGPMYKAEKLAMETGKLFGEDDKLMVGETDDDTIDTQKLSILSFLIPMTLLIGTIFAVIFWTGNIAENGFRGAFINANIVLGIISGFMAGAVGGIVYAVVTKVHSFKYLFDEWTKGILNLMIVPIILVMAWSIGGIASTMGLGAYMSTLVGSYLPVFLVPFIIFLLGAIISFSTGSSWGVFAIMLPIAIPIGVSMGIELPLIIGAVISGGLFGDHCSPISDTTILSSTGAACDHIEHVRTQLPYAITIAVCSSIGFILAGLSGSAIIGLVSTACVGIIAFYLLNKKAKSLYSTLETS